MNLLFITVSALLFGLIIALGVHYLQHERYQMFAIIPFRKKEDATWQGINFTSYGFLIATSSACSILYALILLKSANVPLPGVLAVLLLLFAVCVPAAREIAKLVEKKHHTFTIGGAFFCGLIAMPLLITAVNLLLAKNQMELMHTHAVLAAISISYTLGEGLGRLACISYGCCYGKPLCECKSITQKVYAKTAFVFTGSTQKAVDEGALGGKKLVPIQGVTCIVYTLTALISAYLFLSTHFIAAFLLSLYFSQLWRMYSETLRADFRGFGSFSAYQKMSLAALPMGTLITLLPAQAAPVTPVITQGLAILLEPIPMITLQLMWLIMFFRFGRSTVTSSTLKLHIVQENI